MMNWRYGFLIVLSGMLASACGGDKGSLKAPENLRVQAGDGEATLFWEGVPEAEGYNIYYSREPGITPQEVDESSAARVVKQAVPPAVIRDLENYQGYWFGVTAHDGRRESALSNEVVALPENPFRAIGGINDTGSRLCHDGIGDLVECPVRELPGQDAEHGRDVLAHAEHLQKYGNGTAGFDFTKVARDGSSLPPEAEQWTCVRDNVTGLMWEVKTMDETDIRFDEFLYSWYEPDYQVNGGDPGLADSASECGLETCNTHEYVRRMNEIGLCGHHDWRLPRRREYLSLINYGKRGPAMETDFFRPWGEPGHYVQRSYWTADPYIADVDEHSRAWFVDEDGWGISAPKWFVHKVRVVRDVDESN